MRRPIKKLFNDSPQKDDHQPLTRQELGKILERAATLPRKELSAIQVRLCQGIPGYTMPRPTHGPVAKKALELNKMFIGAITTNQATLPVLADKIYGLYVA